ncbi:ABC transporter ATP-binding protein [Halosimplex sp. TS25]|uniref:ABC transporter ATP-binding protein n=1 Tax=Halosimplex rarum TaxID=3396619 RepID=UPI0039E8FDCF
MSDDVVVSLEDLHVHFENSRLFGLKGAETVRAVDGVSLDIHENEVVALVGESGCGKTTLGKAAIGLHRPTEGSVRYRETDVWEAKDARGLLGGGDLDHDFEEIRRALQIVHQDPEASLDANSRIESILAEPLRRWEPEMSRTDRREHVYGFLEYVGLDPAADFADRYPHQLSGGQQQRVALVRALLMSPDLILADEAISALDVSLRINMMDLMLRLQEAVDTAYLYITHDISNARYVAKKSGGRIGIMYLGKLVEIGPVDRVIENPQHPYTKALLWATPDLASGERASDAHGIEDAPLRAIDVPDAANPPSGCPFHDRCPEAREVCTDEMPPSTAVESGHRTRCFRADDDHGYWESAPLPDADEGSAAKRSAGD